MTGTFPKIEWGPGFLPGSSKEGATISVDQRVSLDLALLADTESGKTMGKVYFREEQSFSYKWNLFLLLPSIGITIGIPLVIRDEIGQFPIVLVILGASLCLLVAGAWFMHVARLITEVRDEGLYIRLSPFKADFIPYSQITKSYARTYRPIKEYGGWGKRTSKKGRVLNTSGNQGVQLEIKGELPLLIGSQRNGALARAIEKAAQRA